MHRRKKRGAFFRLTDVAGKLDFKEKDYTKQIQELTKKLGK